MRNSRSLFVGSIDQTKFRSKAGKYASYDHAKYMNIPWNLDSVKDPVNHPTKCMFQLPFGISLQEFNISLAAVVMSPIIQS